MKKKRKEPINKVAIRLVCTCSGKDFKCECGCTDTTPKFGIQGINDARLCNMLYQMQREYNK